jgi:Cdc6-like AAA superfamily ATPase
MSPFSKIYTVWGQHGVGKSAIVSAVMHYINERTLIKGGFVVVNANGIGNIEVFARKLTIELAEDNDYLFGWQKQEIMQELNKDCLGSFKKVIKQLGQMD